MNRTSLDFLDKMFTKVATEDLRVLVVNQTMHQPLTSDRDNVRVVNSREFGLSKSRNLAIKHAIGDICLIADDDVEYLSSMPEIILQAYQRLPEAAAITFQIKTNDGKAYRNYNLRSEALKQKRQILNVSSIEVSFKLKAIKGHDILFNEMFGLGSNYVLGEECLFLNEVLSVGEKAFYVPKQIVKHSFERSTQRLDTRRLVINKAAVYQLIYPKTYKVHIAKLCFFFLRKRKITLGQAFDTYKVASKEVR